MTTRDEADESQPLTGPQKAALTRQRKAAAEAVQRLNATERLDRLIARRRPLLPGWSRDAYDAMVQARAALEGATK